jgi:O-antigen ligase
MHNPLDQNVRTRRIFTLTLYLLLATIPLLFGARHPLIHGLYSSVILLAGGCWFILHYEQARLTLLRRSNIPPLLIILFVFCTSLSLPHLLLQFLSPQRANLLAEATLLADLENPVNSLSYFAEDTKFYAIYLLGLLLYFFYASSLLSRQKILITTLWIITAVGMFEAVYGLLQVLIPSLGVLWLPQEIGAEGSARGTIIYRNQYAALLNLCWPMSLVLGISLYKPIVEKFTRRRQRKGTLNITDRVMLVFQKSALPFWATAFMILAVIFSRSRGGITVMIMLALLLLVLLPLTRRIKGAAAGAFVLFTAIYGGVMGFRLVIERFYTFYDSALARTGLWRDSLNMLGDHLFTGIGMGAYQYVSPVYLRNVPGNVWFDYAHNEYVELAVELGAPALVLLLAWMGWGLAGKGRKVLQAARRKGSLVDLPGSTIVAIGSYAALLGFLLHGLVDFSWRLPVNALYAATILAMLSSVTASAAEEGNG